MRWLVFLPGGPTFVELEAGWRVRVITPKLKSGGFLLEKAEQQKWGNPITFGGGFQSRRSDHAFGEIVRSAFANAWPLSARPAVVPAESERRRSCGAVLAAPDLQCSGIAGNRLPGESRPILGVDSGGRGCAPRASQRLQLGAGALASWLGFHEDAHVGDVASADNFVKEAEPIGLFRGQFVLPLLEGLTK